MSESDSLELAPMPGSGMTLAQVLGCYELGPKDRLVLAYNIASAYMTFYESNLMRKKWTSSNIHFMSADSGEHNSTMPLRAYITFPSGGGGEESPEFIMNQRILHRYPRIFDLGVLLLEVGLGRKFPSVKYTTEVSQMNGNHRIAQTHLRELKGSTWKGFQHKSCFDEIVEFCIEIKALATHGSNDHQARAGTAGPTKTTTNDQNGVLERKSIIFKKVVNPLRWLVNEGFGYQDKTTIYISRKHESTLSGECEQGPPVHTVAHRQWLPNLHQLGKSFALACSRRPIIAILDTGLDPGSLRSVLGEDAASRIIFKDFVAGLGMADRYGHGTLMTMLAMKCAPLATIIVARIAETSRDLERRSSEIVKAIEWASSGKQRADIISMSFGFPQTDWSIKQAIERAGTSHESKIVFMASAGNSASEFESFPARHESVISIHATDPFGYFLRSSSRYSEYAPVALGTYGDGLPPETFSVISEKYPNAVLPGSSIATAVAAGIGATMLAYVDTLPALGISTITRREEEKLQLLRETKGMEALFRHMEARCVHRQLWIDPISFWRDHSSHEARYRAILGCMEHFARVS